MTNIVGQLFKSLDPWPGFQITSFKIQVSPVDGRKTLILEEALQKPPLPSRMEQKCSVRLFLTTPECAVFLPIQ